MFSTINLLPHVAIAKIGEESKKIKVKNWLEENCEATYGIIHDTSLKFYYPISEISPLGDKFPAPKVEMFHAMIVMFEDEGDYTKFLLTWSGKDE